MLIPTQDSNTNQKSQKLTHNSASRASVAAVCAAGARARAGAARLRSGAAWHPPRWQEQPTPVPRARPAPRSRRAAYLARLMACPRLAGATWRSCSAETKRCVRAQALKASASLRLKQLSQPQRTRSCCRRCSGCASQARRGALRAFKQKSAVRARPPRVAPHALTLRADASCALRAGTPSPSLLGALTDLAARLPHKTKEERKARVGVRTAP